MNTKHCTEIVYPPGLAGIGNSRKCGNPSKGNNKSGDPRCGIHSDEAYARRDAQRAEKERKEQERAERWLASSYRNMLSTMSEREARAIFNALESKLSGGNAYGDLASAMAKLAKVKTHE